MVTKKELICTDIVDSFVVYDKRDIIEGQFIFFSFIVRPFCLGKWPPWFLLQILFTAYTFYCLHFLLHILFTANTFVLNSFTAYTGYHYGSNWLSLFCSKNKATAVELTTYGGHFFAHRSSFATKYALGWTRKEVLVVVLLSFRSLYFAKTQIYMYIL